MDVFDAVSGEGQVYEVSVHNIFHQPWFSAPQQSQVKTLFLFPVEVSRRFPQSVQNTRDPTADILGDVAESKLVLRLRQKIPGTRTSHTGI